MKFDYVIHVTRSGDRTYTVEILDQSGEKPVATRPLEGLSWQKLWTAVPKGISDRENKKIEAMKAAAALPPEPKDWVPSAAGQPAASAPVPAAAAPPSGAPATAPVAAPKPNRYIKQPASGAGASSNPNPA